MRINGCGAVHLANRVRYCGPPSFRTTGNHFTYDYTFIPQGILRSPLILRHPGELPFAVRQERPNKTTLAAMEEAVRIANDPNTRRFATVDELMENLEK